MDRVGVGDLTIAFERKGSGPALVLLHGYVGDGPSTWRNQIDALSAGYTVLAWDAPGAGKSTDPREDLGVDGYADCLAAFLATLGIDQAHVGGLSFGGSLAIAFASRHPSVPLSLTLISAYAGWAGSLPADEVDRRLAQGRTLSRLASEEFCRALLPTMFQPSSPADDVAAFSATVADFHPAGFRAMARASAADLRPALPEIDVPTLLIYGEQDVRAPRAVAEHLHQAIKGSRLVFLPGAAHVCTIDVPDAVSTEMAAFLESTIYP